MAVTTKKQFPATTNATTTVFSPVGIQLNNQDDLDVYVTLSGGTRVLQLRQSTGSTAQSDHPQVNNTDGLYFPAVSAGTNLINYTLSSDNNTITFNSALPSGAVVFCERRTRDADSAYTTFASGSTIRATDLNNSSTESNFTAQDARNKALDIENAIFNGVQPTINGVPQPFVNSSNIIDGGIGTADIADDAITNAKIANLAVSGAEIANTTIAGTKLVNGAVDTTQLATDAVTTAKIANSAVTNDKIADGTIATAKYQTGSVSGTVLANGAVTEPKIQDGSVTTAKLTNQAVTADKLANDTITSTQLGTNSVDTNALGAGVVTSAKIANNAVTTDKIADSELSTLAGMQSATASKLADSTALTADIADLNQIDGMAKQTTITDDDTKFPTSGAVVDYVAAQLEPFGGFEAIANESSFPNTQPASGVVISIADAGGMSVSGSGTASGATVGGTTVNITGIASNFNGSTVDNGIRFLVVSTGSGQNYTYHKATLKEDDLLNLSGDINDFSERYRVGSSNPTTSLDNGDLFFNTGSGKLLVYNGTNSAWEETQSVGNFFINTLSSSSATGGGSATPNGTAYRFTLSNAGANAQQHLVSVDGVIQKPNSGTSQPSEGFAIDGGDIIFGSAPVNGASLFVITIGASVSIGTPSNNTVNSAILQNGSVTTAKIVDDAVTSDKIGTLTGNVDFADNANARFGTGNDLKIYHDGTNSFIKDGTGSTGLVVQAPLLAIKNAAGSENMIVATENGNVELNFDNSKKLETITWGVDIQGNTRTSGDFVVIDNGKFRAGYASDLQIYHDGSDSIIKNNTGGLYIDGNGVNGTYIRAKTGENSIVASPDGAVSLFFDNSKKIETVTAGISVTGQVSSDTLHIADGSDGIKVGDSDDLKIYHDGSNSYIKETGTGALRIQSANTVDIEKDDGTDVARFHPDGSVELFHNGSKKFETRSGGIGVFGHVEAGDNNKLMLGDGNDIQIYHDGSESYVKNTNSNSNLILEGAHGVDIKHGSENMAKFKPDAAVELYYDNVKKVETTSNGAAVTGYLTQSAPISWMAYADSQWYDITAGNSIYPFSFNNTAHNIGGHWKTSGTDEGLFVVPVGGIYQLNWNIFMACTTTQTTSATLEMYVKKNGSVVSRLHNKKGYGNMGDDQQVVNLCVTEQLAANDKIGVIFSSYGATWRIYGGHSTFSGFLVG